MSGHTGSTDRPAGSPTNPAGPVQARAPTGLAISVRDAENRLVAFVPALPGLSLTFHVPEPASFVAQVPEEERDDPAHPDLFRRPSFTEGEYRERQGLRRDPGETTPR